MNHKGTKQIETDMLLLRRFRIEDAEAMFRNWASDDRVTQYLSWPSHENVAATRRLLNDWISQYERLDYYSWAIELKEIHEPIGNISVVSYEKRTASAMLGWCLGENWWGRELMPEAARAVLQFLFEAVDFNRLAAKHDTENAKSGRVMQKIGMVREGVLRAGGRNNRGIVDEAYYSILREEYEKSSGQSVKLRWRMGPDT